jgi:hypothetical protein
MIKLNFKQVRYDKQEQRHKKFKNQMIKLNFIAKIWYQLMWTWRVRTLEPTIKDWTQPMKAKIKSKRTWPSNYLNKKIIVIGWKPQLVDYKEWRTRIRRMSATKK